MASKPLVYVRAVGDLPELLDLLSYYDSLPFSYLAERIGSTAKKVRDLLLAYYLADDADATGLLPGSVPELRFIDDDGAETDPTRATRVGLHPAALPGLGLALMPAHEYALLYRAGRDRLYLEPEDTLLRAAVDKLREALGGSRKLTTVPAGLEPDWWHRMARERQRVQITYVRAWTPGTTERVIEPYRVLRTRRGWEVDAGPVREDGDIRTYLLSGVRDRRALGEEFGLPSDLDDLLDRRRQRTSVEFELPRERRWVVDEQAEAVAELAWTTSTVRIRAEFIAPVRQRVGLVLLAAGPAASVVSPDKYVHAREAIVPTLRAHHARLPTDS